MSQKVFPAVGIDIGSSRTRLAVCMVEDERLRFLGHGESASHGWVKGRIADQNAVTDCLLEVLRQAESRAQVSIDAATIGFRVSTLRRISVRRLTSGITLRRIRNSLASW